MYQTKPNTQKKTQTEKPYCSIALFSLHPVAISKTSTSAGLFVYQRVVLLLFFEAGLLSLFPPASQQSFIYIFDKKPLLLFDSLSITKFSPFLNLRPPIFIQSPSFPPTLPCYCLQSSICYPHRICFSPLFLFSNLQTKPDNLLSLITQTKPFEYFLIYHYQTQTHKCLSPILTSFLSSPNIATVSVSSTAMKRNLFKIGRASCRERV